MHSRSGFSGSPVFAYRTFGSDLTQVQFGEPFDSIELEVDELELEPSRLGSMTGGQSFSGRIRGRSGRLMARNLFKFLGIHWGQFPELWELQDKKRLKKSRKGLILDGAYVDGLSGMTCVIPAWNILEVLDMPDLGKLREPAIAAAIEAQKLRRFSRPLPEAAAKTKASDENPTHKEDFTSLPDAAAKTKPQGDQT
jgi:hypothetical protein